MQISSKFPVLTGLIGSYLVRYHYLVRNLHMVPKRWSGGAGIEASVDSKRGRDERASTFYHILRNMMTASVPLPHRMLKCLSLSDRVFLLNQRKINRTNNSVARAVQ